MFAMTSTRLEATAIQSTRQLTRGKTLDDIRAAHIHGPDPLVDFPLADFVTDAPDKSFLSGVTSGREINTVTIDGVPCRHLLFTQPPGIELELWIEKNDTAVPRRLIVTYRSEPAQPRLRRGVLRLEFLGPSVRCGFHFPAA